MFVELETELASSKEHLLDTTTFPLLSQVLTIYIVTPRKRFRKLNCVLNIISVIFSADMMLRNQSICDYDVHFQLVLSDDDYTDATFYSIVGSCRFNG